MSKIDSIKRRLRNNPNGSIAWMDGGYLPNGGYETAEVGGLQVNLMLMGYDDVYIITVLPGDDYGVFDAWVRRLGSNDMVHMLSKTVRDPEDVVVAALETLPDYIGVV